MSVKIQILKAFGYKYMSTFAYASPVIHKLNELFLYEIMHVKKKDFEKEI